MRGEHECMKNRNFLVTFLLLICMLFALPVAANAAYKNQWVTTGGNTYYYGSNGKKYTGGPKAIKDGDTTSLYLFDSKGVLVKNQITYIKSKKRFYYSLSSGKLLTSFKKVGSNYYYGTSGGYLKTGLQKYNGFYYYFDTSKACRAAKNTWKTVNGKTYYFKGNGKAYRKGVYKINGKNYRFVDSCRVSGVFKISGYYYGFHSKYGYQVFGLRKFSGNYYYFDKSNHGRAVTSDFYTINGKNYYFGSTGIRQTGWLTIGSKRYYLDPSNSGAQTFGSKTIDGVSYDFGTQGYVTITWSASSYKTIRVNRANNVVTVYEGNTPIKAMTCSTGRSGHETPVGTFTVLSHYRWWMLDGPSMGQYCSHFLSSYLFHSVPVYGTSKNAYGVRATDYNMLGKAASGGCIRLTVADAKWIYDNVPIGSTVIISDSQPMPLGKPSITKMAAGTVGKDPTDIWS